MNGGKLELSLSLRVAMIAAFTDSRISVLYNTKIHKLISTESLDDDDNDGSARLPAAQCYDSCSTTPQLCRVSDASVLLLPSLRACLVRNHVPDRPPVERERAKGQGAASGVPCARARLQDDKMLAEKVSVSSPSYRVRRHRARGTCVTRVT